METAVAALDDAVAAGAVPASKWRARQAIFRAGADRQRRAEALTQFVNDDPVSRALLLSDAGEIDLSLAVLGEWVPFDDVEKELKATLLAQLTAVDDIDAAVRIAREAADEFESSDCALLCADYLLQRGSKRETPIDFADLEESLRLAIGARDAIRKWRGPSHGAVGRAMSAAQALGRKDEAWKFSQTPPEGEATEGEAASNSVRGEAALLAAQLGNRPHALQLLEGVTDKRIRHEAQAIFAMTDGDNATALREWQAAAVVADSPQDVLRTCHFVALHGVRSTELSRLAETHPEIADNIGLIADAFAEQPAAVAKLKARAHANRLCAYALVEWHIRHDTRLEAAALAERSGTTWGDPNFNLMAAQLFLESGEHDAAQRAARETLRVSGSSSGKRLEAYDVLIRSLTIEQHWEKASTAAAEVLALDRSNVSAAWVLTIAQVQLGEFDDAWHTYTEIAGRPDPRIEQEAVVRISLWHKFERTAAGLDKLFEIADRWDQSDAVRSAAAMALIQFPVAEGDEATASRVQERLGALVATLENIFIRQEIDPEDPLATLTALVGDLPDTTEFDEKVASGRLPLGFFASIHGKNYAELLACSTSNALFSGDLGTFSTDIEHAERSSGFPVIVDITALLALNALDPALREQLLGFAGDLRVSRRQRAEIVDAIESLSRLSTLTVGKSGDSARVQSISGEEAANRLRRAESLKNSFDKITLASEHPPLEDPVPVWLSGLETARAEEASLWCDDAIIRREANRQGVNCFGTQTLIEVLRRRGDLSDDLATHCQAVLLSHYYVGAEFRRDWALRSAEIDAWKPRGTAAFVAFASVTNTPNDVVDFAVHAMAQNLGDPVAIVGWVEAISTWLIRVSGSDQAGGQNLAKLLLQLFGQPWLNSSRLPFVLQGLRAAVSTSGIPDPFEPAMENYYRALVRATGHPAAMARVRSLTALVGSTDRLTVIKVALTAPN